VIPIPAAIFERAASPVSLIAGRMRNQLTARTTSHTRQRSRNVGAPFAKVNEKDGVDVLTVSFYEPSRCRYGLALREVSEEWIPFQEVARRVLILKASPIRAR
jgi:hypothetical protein